MFDVLGRIDELRIARGWSNYKLSKITGIPQSTIGTWYQKHLLPPVDKIELICDAFDVTLSEFFSSDPGKKDCDPLIHKISLLSENQKNYLSDTIDMITK